jgi:predicted RNA binding protein YcfA (HicA-like mRNA interferase family)
MARLAPIHWKRLEKVFFAVGFVFVRQEGSYRSYSRVGTLRPIVIPTYGEVPVAVIKSNLKTADLSRGEYFRLLESIEAAMFTLTRLNRYCWGLLVP